MFTAVKIKNSVYWLFIAKLQLYFKYVYNKAIINEVALK